MTGPQGREACVHLSASLASFARSQPQGRLGARFCSTIVTVAGAGCARAMTGGLTRESCVQCNPTPFLDGCMHALKLNVICQTGLHALVWLCSSKFQASNIQ